MSRTIGRLMMVFCLALLCSAVHGATNYVSLTGNHVAPYTTWETAATNIQAAIGRGGGIATPGGVVANCIVFSNSSRLGATVANWHTNSIGGTFSYCCTTPMAPGTSNITSDPQLCPNYLVDSVSPCYERGDIYGWMAGACDLGGSPRMIGTAPDIGAYEGAVTSNQLVFSESMDGANAPSGWVIQGEHDAPDRFTPGVPKTIMDFFQMGQGFLRLTSTGMYQRASAFYTNALVWSDNWTIAADIRIDRGGDGMAFSWVGVGTNGVTFLSDINELLGGFGNWLGAPRGIGMSGPFDGLGAYTNVGGYSVQFLTYSNDWITGKWIPPYATNYEATICRNLRNWKPPISESPRDYLGISNFFADCGWVRIVLMQTMNGTTGCFALTWSPTYAVTNTWIVENYPAYPAYFGVSSGTADGGAPHDIRNFTLYGSMALNTWNDPFIDITNTAASVTYITTTYSVAGTNNAHVLGTMWVSNATAGGVAQSFPATASWTTPAISLAVGTNTIVVYGTNTAGTIASDSVVITRAMGTSATHYVSLSGAHVPPYATWVSAATNIQAAIDAAAVGDTVVVTNGTYITYTQLTVTNGIIVQSVNGAKATILDGGLATSVILFNHSNGVIRGFTIMNGRSSSYGAGVRMGYGLLENCIIKGNSVDPDTGVGGGVDTHGTIRGCLIYGNTARDGGGVRFSVSGSLENCTIISNVSATSAVAVDATVVNVRNSIIYHNTPSNIHTFGGGSVVQEYTCTVPLLPGSGNLSNLPLFVDLNSGDCHLQVNSPCIDAGTNLSWMIGARDCDGTPRINNGRIDMGSYEYTTASTPFVDITNVPVPVANSVATYTVAGTNTANVVGWLVWTNTINAANGSVPVSSLAFQLSNIPLSVGTNTIIVVGTNVLGVVAADTTTVVRLSVPQLLSVQPSMLDFGTNGTYLTVMLGNLSTGNVDCAITPGAAWLSVSPVSGSVSTQSVPVGVTVNRAGMANAFYSGLLTIVPSEGAAIVATCTMVVADNGVVAHPGGPYVADQGSPVTLDGSASLGTGLRYSWNIGDLFTPFSTVNVRYVYTGYVPGTSDVILTVRDTGSRLSANMTNIIVRNVAPSLEIGGPYTGTVGRAVNFRAIISDPGTNDTVEIRWDFGTGWSAWQPASATNTPFSFASGGNYVVQAETRDNYGGIGSDTAAVFIDIPNLPPDARATLGTPGVVLSNFASMHMGFILDGTGSTDDRTNTVGLYFDWREDVRNPAKPLLTDAQRRMIVVTNSITFPLPGIYKYHLVVNDGEYNSEPATVQINVPGIHGLVKAEGTMALLPVWGVAIVATNEATGAADWCVSDTEGKFVLDTGVGNSRMLVLSRGDQQTLRNVHVDADGVTWREPEGMLAFPARPCGLSAIVNTGYVGGVWLGLPGASARIVVGDTVAYNGDSDLMGQMAFGGIPELFPRTATVNYQVLYQKGGYESAVMALQSDPAVVAQHTPQLDTSIGYVVRGIVLGTNDLPAGGIEVDFGPAFTPALSAQDGTFAASNVMRGEYFVELSGNDYDTTYATVVVPQGSPDYLLPQPLRIRGGRFSVYGEVINGENGMPIYGATTTVVQTGLRKMYPRMATTHAAGTTTRTGYYDLPVVKGTRTLQIEAPGYEGTTIVVNAESHVQQPVQLTPVPEPMTIAFLMLTAGHLMLRRHRVRVGL